MVVFVDLDGDDEEAPEDDRRVNFIVANRFRKLRVVEDKAEPEILDRTGDDGQLVNANRGSFAAALACYPIALSICSHLDLNDLHALSRTCRRLRGALLQFHNQLVRHSLRCTFDSQPLLADLLASSKPIRFAGEDLNPVNIPANVLAAIQAEQRTLFSDHLVGSHSKLFKSSKIGTCARDLVAECRKCGVVVCRNCSTKPPSDRCLEDRFRRLCSACLEAPWQDHTIRRPSLSGDIDSLASSSSSSIRSVQSPSPTSLDDELAVPLASGSDPQTCVSPAFARSPCTCATRGVFLCSSCGHNLRVGDTTYKRVWTWRSRYSTHIGGLGTGMGEGDQGQKCARGADCLDQTGGGLCWVEIDCCEQSSQDHHRSHAVFSPTRDYHPDPAPATAIGEPESATNEKPGYLRQEIEGIGGVVKKKVKKKVRVGATVWEFDDERETGRYLEREASGLQRSWCGWCSRVALGKSDRESREEQY